jgi:DNA polymerase III sliding clamp (beta) subunit (PCNA family)
MSTDSMRKAFRSLKGPDGFQLQIVDHDNFLTVKANEKEFMSLSGEERKQAVEYMIRTKKALEDNGAIVLLVREGGKEL